MAGKKEARDDAGITVGELPSIGSQGEKNESA